MYLSSFNMINYNCFLTDLYPIYCSIRLLIHRGCTVFVETQRVLWY